MSLTTKTLEKIRARGNHQEIFYYIMRHEFNVASCQTCHGKGTCNYCKKLLEQRQQLCDIGIELSKKEKPAAKIATEQQTLA